MSDSFKVLVCRGPVCGDKRNSRAVAKELQRCIAEQGVEGVELAWQSCFGRCRKGVNVLVRRKRGEPELKTFGVAAVPAARGARATMYNRVSPGDVIDIVQTHLQGGRVLRRLSEAPRSRRAKPAGSTPTESTNEQNGRDGNVASDDRQPGEPGLQGRDEDR